MKAAGVFILLVAVAISSVMADNGALRQPPPTKQARIPWEGLAIVVNRSNPVNDVTLPELGGYRWLTVGPPGQTEVSLLLKAIPGPQVLDAATADQIRSVMAKGWAGNVLLTTDDAQATYEELTARGLEFTEPPEERPYGIDSAFRDPSGNQFRLTQVREPAAV
jgi:catechol 2,3-dioxygenase-like lactoylglutathione lyase family enzyme